MRYVAYGEGGGPEVLRIADGLVPAFGPRDVLVQVHFAGINRPDLLQRSGKYPPPPGASPILGLEVAGRVAAVGTEVTSWKVGDHVCALTPAAATQNSAGPMRVTACLCLGDSILQAARPFPKPFSLSGRI